MVHQSTPSTSALLRWHSVREQRHWSLRHSTLRWLSLVLFYSKHHVQSWRAIRSAMLFWIHSLLGAGSRIADSNAGFSKRGIPIHVSHMLKTRGLVVKQTLHAISPNLLILFFRVQDFQHPACWSTLKLSKECFSQFAISCPRSSLQLAVCTWYGFMKMSGHHILLL